MVSITEGIGRLRIGQLFSKLHNSIRRFSSDASRMVEKNDEVNTDTINELRDSITERLGNNENIDENKALLRTLDLLLTDKAFIRLVRDDADRWLGFLDAIEESLLKVDKDLGAEDRAEIEKAMGMLHGIRHALRKEG